MKAELTDLSVVKKSLSIEVPADVVAKALKETTSQYAKKARIPGFREGKVPLSLVRSRFGSEIRDDVRDQVVSRYYHEATREHGLQPLGEPTLEDLEFEDGKPLSFKTVFEVLPPIELKSYRDLESSRPTTTVEDAEVEQSLEEIRQSRANLVVEEGREAATGDIVIADLHGEPEDGEPFERERVMIEVGATDALYLLSMKRWRAARQRTNSSSPSSIPMSMVRRSWRASRSPMTSRSTRSRGKNYRSWMTSSPRISVISTTWKSCGHVIREDLEARKEHEIGSGDAAVPAWRSCC